MSELITAARPYARAVFELGQADSELDKWTEQLSFMATIMADPEMSQVLDNPKLTKAEQAGMFVHVCGDKIGVKATNLVKLLADNDKLSLLPEIAALYEQFKTDHEGLVEAEVVSALEISADQEQAIASSLKKRLGRDVHITTRIDKSLMGGAIIRAGDLVIDGSLKGRLAKVTTALSR